MVDSSFWRNSVISISDLYVVFFFQLQRPELTINSNLEALKVQNVVLFHWLTRGEFFHL